MEMVQFNEYLVSTEGTKGISMYNAACTYGRFHVFTG